MKSNRKLKQFKRKKEFRYKDIEVKTKAGKIKHIKHPAFIFLEKEEMYIYVTLTHSKNVPGCIVIKLKKNPNPNDETDSYYVAEIKMDNKIKFGSRILNWKMSTDDEKEIRNFFDKIKDDSAA